MDPRSSAGKSILALGSVLTILGVGTWMLVAGSTLAVIAPALVGAGFLLIGGICLKVGGCHRQLLWLSVLIALLVIWSSFDAILESLRFADGVPPSPTGSTSPRCGPTGSCGGPVWRRAAIPTSGS